MKWILSISRVGHDKILALAKPTDKIDEPYHVFGNREKYLVGTPSAHGLDTDRDVIKEVFEIIDRGI